MIIQLIVCAFRDPKVTGKEGFWLGETKSVTGIFPSTGYTKKIDT